AYGRQAVPFERLVEELAPQRTLAHAPLVQVMFTLQAADVPMEVGGLRFQTIDAESHAAKFDLVLGLEERDDRLAGGFQYRTDLFEEATIAAMARRWQHLLDAAVAHPAVAIDALGLYE